MFRKALFSPIFLVSFIIFVILFFVLSAGVGEWFNVFKVWTVNQNLKLGSSFVKSSQVYSPVIGQTLAQLKVGNDQQFGASAVGNASTLSSRAQTLAETDILRLVSESNDPDSVFDLHQAQMEQLLDEMWSSYDELSKLSEERKIAADECLIKKKEWDQQFFVWVQEEDENKYLEWLEQSKEFAPCYITNRIEANAYAYLAQRAVAGQQILQTRFDTLWANRDTLLSSYPLLQGNLAEQLVNFKQTLNTVNNTDFSQITDLLDFGMPDANTPLPSLHKVWFNDNNYQVPTYLEPAKVLK